MRRDEIGKDEIKKRENVILVEKGGEEGGGEEGEGRERGKGRREEWRTVDERRGKDWACMRRMIGWQEVFVRDIAVEK